jgi:hypothetical protein
MMVVADAGPLIALAKVGQNRSQDLSSVDDPPVAADTIAIMGL